MNISGYLVYFQEFVVYLQHSINLITMKRDIIYLFESKACFNYLVVVFFIITQIQTIHFIPCHQAMMFLSYDIGRSCIFISSISHHLMRSIPTEMFTFCKILHHLIQLLAGIRIINTCICYYLLEKHSQIRFNSSKPTSYIPASRSLVTT